MLAYQTNDFIIFHGNVEPWTQILKGAQIVIIDENKNLLRHEQSYTERIQQFGLSPTGQIAHMKMDSTTGFFGDLWIDDQLICTLYDPPIEQSNVVGRWLLFGTNGIVTWRNGEVIWVPWR